MAAPAVVRELVDRFPAPGSPTFLALNETEVRREFIDPFFKALGWDVDNVAGEVRNYKEVIHEDRIRIANTKGRTSAPDYAFRIGGKRRFFVEAKKPAVNLRDDPRPAYQLRRYAWSATLPLSIVSDFQEFSVYNCTIEPSPDDRADTACEIYIAYQDYEKEWERIRVLFSKEAVLDGELERYITRATGRQGTRSVDSAFLRDMESFRLILARDIAARNTNLTTPDLNYAVQMTLNRLLFLRVCEDRGVEPFDQLRLRVEHDNAYTQLADLFRLADDRYNSGLFHFHAERGRSTPTDDFTLDLDIDSAALRQVIRRLYYPHPYQFAMIPVEIMGQVYERFIGQVIEVTPTHDIRIVERREVPKKGGIFYTPAHIVDYIVQHSLSPLLEGKTPNEVSSLRLLDAACGSGTFLGCAYRHLLEWHRAKYLEAPEKNRKLIYQDIYGDWQLTVAERKRILLNNIFGVDVDSQAVENTKLALLLIVLEGATTESLGFQLQFARERALPDLDNNIKCGNSLVGPDYFDIPVGTTQESPIGIPFDWRAEFSHVLEAGGFDAVIGNPPYVRPHNLSHGLKEYLWAHYSTFVGKSDLYCCFIQRAIELLRPGGYLGYVVSNGWLRLDSFQTLRRYLLDRTSLDRIVDFTDDVFPTANVKVSLLLLSNLAKSDHIVRVATTSSRQNLSQLLFKEISQDAFVKSYGHIIDLSLGDGLTAIKNKMQAGSVALGDLFDLAFGLKTGDDSRFLGYSPDTPQHKPLLRGEDIHRYSRTFKGEYVWYVPRMMIAHKKSARPGSAERFEQPKVLIRDTGGGLAGTYDDEHFYVKDVLVLTDRRANPNNLKYLAAVLNSKLMKFYYETSFPTLHVQRNELASLPIHVIDLANERTRAYYTKLVLLVEKMLAFTSQLGHENTPYGRALCQRQIEATDRQLDGLVYELYSLTQNEIELVEGKEAEQVFRQVSAGEMAKRVRKL